MKPIDRAAEALAASLYGEVDWTSVDPVRQAELRKAVRAAMTTLREPDEEMTFAGMEIIRYVREGESSEAHRSDAANTWRFMVDALLAGA